MTRHHAIAALAAALSAAGCAATECADGADVACLQAIASEEDLAAAVELIGPCYAFGAALCERADYCGASPLPADECISWWVAEVCAGLDFDPDQHGHCATWADDLACEYFDQGAAFYNGNPQPCEAEYPHPLGGAQ